MKTLRHNLRAPERVWARRLATLCLAAIVLTAGCKQEAQQVDPEGPGRLLLQLRQVQQEHRYGELQSLVDPTRLATLVRTLMAVDRLLTASQLLQEAVEQHVGPTAAEVCNLSVLADYLGPFSRNVQVVSTRIDGDTAWVAYQIGERVPIARAQMRLEGRQWRYIPDDADEKLPDVLLRLTERLVALKAEALRGQYNEPAFIEEYGQQIQEPLATHLAEAEQARKARSGSDGRN